MCSAHESVPDVYIQGTHHFLTRMLSMVWKDLFNFGAEHTRKKVMRMLRVRISCRRLCSACFEGTFSNFICALSAPISSWRECSVHAPQFMTRMLSAHTSSWRVCSVHAPQFLTRMLSVRTSSWRVCSVQATVPDAYALNTLVEIQYKTEQFAVYTI